MEKIDEVYEFYNGGAEIGRLERGLGVVEFDRSKEIIGRYLVGTMSICDIGGGIGMYSNWLAGHGSRLISRRSGLMVIEDLAFRSLSELQNMKRL